LDIKDAMAIAMAAMEIKKMLPQYKQIAEAQSQVMKIYYDALVASGFTTDQALYLVGQHGIDIGLASKANGGGQA
jgi:hypothetical protein